jgi:hypothetical protein
MAYAKAGYDCSEAIQNVYAGAYDEFRTDPGFWMRYFNPSPGAAVLFNDDPEAESIAAWDSGGHYVGCISSPYQYLLAGTQPEGQADAQLFASAMLSAYNAVGPLDLPENNMLYCWLDQEYFTSLSQPYWDGWSLFIANYNFASLGTYPLYPCAYCTPDSPYPNCSTFAAASGLEVPSALWVPVWEVCGDLAHPPAWDAQECSTYDPACHVPSKLWQFGEQNGCSYSAAVDLDVGASGWNPASYSFRIVKKP